MNKKNKCDKKERKKNKVNWKKKKKKAKRKKKYIKIAWRNINLYVYDWEKIEMPKDRKWKK